MAEKLGRGESLFDHPLIRYPMIQANYIEFDINQTDLVGQTFPLYMKTELVLNGWTIQKTLPVYQTTTKVRFDLEQLAPKQIGIQSGTGFIDRGKYVGMSAGDPHAHYKDRLLFDGSKSQLQVISPLVVTTIYNEDPETVPEGDIVATLSNLVYYGYEYQRFALDEDYAHDYDTKWEQIEANHEAMKPVMIAIGVLMIAAGIALGATGVGVGPGLTSALFGLDMITSNIGGKGIIDIFLTGVLKTVFELHGKDTTFMEAEHFSFFQFTSSSIQNLIFTQLTFMAIGGVLGLGGKIRSLPQAAQTIEKASTAVAYTVTGQIAERIGLVDIVLKNLIHQIMHFASGTIFLLVLHWASSQSDIMPAMLLQGLIAASVIVSTVANVIRFKTHGAPVRDWEESIKHYMRERQLWYGFNWVAKARATLSQGALGKALLGLEVMTFTFKMATIVGRGLSYGL